VDYLAPLTYRNDDIMKRLLFLALALQVSMAASGNVETDIPVTGVFPLSVSNGVLVTASSQPYMIIGDSPQAAIMLPVVNGTGGTTSDGANNLPTYFADRAARGFNTLWVNAICEQYTACTHGGVDNAQTFDGIAPFTGQLNGIFSGQTCPESPVVNTACYDLATPNSVYWARIDAIVALAGQYGMQILMNVLPTDACKNPNSFMQMFLNNNAVNPAKVSGFASFLASRYGDAPNLIWKIGNDYTCWNTASDDVTYAFASALKTADAGQPLHHLITCGPTAQFSGNPAVSCADINTNGHNWAELLGLNGVDTEYPVYDQTLHAYGQKSTTLVGFFDETSYEGEDNTGCQNGNPDGGCVVPANSNLNDNCRSGTGANSIRGTNPPSCAIRSRHDTWWALLSGASAGFLYSNRFTWQLASGWNTPGTGVCDGTLPIIDTPSVCQLNYMAQFLRQFAWYNLTPDEGADSGGTLVASPFVTSSHGSYASSNSVLDFYITSAAASDNSFAVAYISAPTSAASAVTFDANKVNGVMNIVAQWYDPTKDPTLGSSYVTICTTTCVNGLNTATPPSTAHADGTFDYVLLVKAFGPATPRR
jgi:hypothetical protein